MMTSLWSTRSRSSWARICSGHLQLTIRDINVPWGTYRYARRVTYL